MPNQGERCVFMNRTCRVSRPPAAPCIPLLGAFVIIGGHAIRRRCVNVAKLNGATQQAARRPVMGRLAETEMKGRGNFYRVVYARVRAIRCFFNGISPAPVYRGHCIERACARLRACRRAGFEFPARASPRRRSVLVGSRFAFLCVAPIKRSAVPRGAMKAAAETDANLYRARGVHRRR